MHYLSFIKEGNEIKVALLQRVKKEVSVCFLRRFPSNVKLLDILPAGLLKKKPLIITALEANEVIFREIHLKVRSKREILSVLPFQIESLFPYSSEELLLLPIFYLSKEANTEVSLWATSVGHLKNHLDLYGQIEMDPDIVGNISTGLSRFASHYYPENSSLMIFHFGWEQSTLVIVKNKKIVFSQSQNSGIYQLLTALMQDLQSANWESALEQAQRLSLLDLEKTPFPRLFSHTLSLRHEIDRMTLFITKKYPEIIDVLITGHLQPYFFIKDFLKANFSNPLSCIPHKTQCPDLSFADSIGVCLDAIKKDKQSVQFLKGSLIPIKKQKSQQNFIKKISIVLALAAFCFFLAAHLNMAKRQEALFNKLNAQGYPKFSSTEEAISYLRKQNSAQKRPFPYAVNTAKLSDVLAWVSSHPKLKSNIQITGLRYSLVKYPKLGKEEDGRYLAKLDLELSSDSPRIAREFYNGLINGEELVDAKKEIQWSVKDNTYQVSFYLLTPKKHS